VGILKVPMREASAGAPAARRKRAPGAPAAVGGGNRSTLNRLRWATILLPIAFLAAIDATTNAVLRPALGPAPTYTIVAVTMVVTVVVFSTVVFGRLDRMQRKIMRQNEELSALNTVSDGLGGTIDLPEAMSRALGMVMNVTGASAGVLLIDAGASGEPPLRVSAGAATELGRLDAIALEQEHANAAPGRPLVDIVGLAGADEGLEHGTPAGTYCSVQLRAQQHYVGTMQLLAAGPSHLGAEGSERLLTAMSGQIAMAIQSSRLFGDLLRRGNEAQALYEIGLKIASLQDVEQILNSVVGHARDLLGTEASALCVAGADGNEMTVAGAAGPRGAFLRKPAHVSLLPVVPSAAAAPADDPTHANCPALAPGYRTHCVSAPLRLGTSVIGDLCVSSSEPRTFTQREKELLDSLADMSAIAINNARLLESERQVAVLEERVRLSREMHDSLAQVLGYLQLKARTTRRTVAQKELEKADAELEEMAALASEAYQDVREAILGLRETVSPGVGIVGTLREYLQKFSRQSGVRAEIEVKCEQPRLSPEIEVQLVRVIQEALTNVRKHAGADRAWIRISQHEGEVRIAIEDNGRGFDPARLEANGDHFGIRTMQERVERVGGQFRVSSQPGAGTTVAIHFPAMEANAAWIP
jgi:signal transduction histidine kinase